MNSNQDAEHIRLLSIFHYVLAGVFGLFSLFPVIHLILGIAMVSGAFDEMANIPDGEAPPAAFGWLFIIFPLIFILCGLAMATCMAIAGQRLGRHTSYMFCLVVAGFECIFMPFGTVLGVFTIIVLMRPTVKTLFGVAETGQVDPYPPDS